MAIRKKNYMAVDQLNSHDYNWNLKGYSDKLIISNAKYYKDSNSKHYPLKDSKHYLYTVYQRYYFPLLNEFRHKIDDYNYIFGNSLLTVDKSKLIIKHVAMRIEFFSFIDYLRNSNRKHKSGKKKKFVPVKMASTLHDADKSVNGDIVKPHIHFAIKLGKQTTPNQLSKWSGIAPQYFESTKGGRWAFDNELAYLTHAKQPLKHLYDHTNVWSNKPIFDYGKYYAKHHKRWARHRASASQKAYKQGAPWLENQVINGKITYNEMLSNDVLYKIYTTDIQKIKDLFQARADRVAELTREELKARKFGLSVIYIWGPSGSGKTTEADRIIEALRKHYRWSCYKTVPSGSSNSHPFDKYNGQSIVYWDEARNTDLTASEWLQLLDPRHENSIDARYSPKEMAARVFLITTIEPPEQFFGFMKGIHQSEPLTQFMRRLGIVIQIKEYGDKRMAFVRKIAEADKNETIPLKTDQDGRILESKSSRYVEDPNPDAGSDNVPAKPMRDVTNYALNYIKKNNDPKLKHNPGERPKISDREYHKFSDEKNSTAQRIDSDDLPF